MYADHFGLFIDGVLDAVIGWTACAGTIDGPFPIYLGYEPLGNQNIDFTGYMADVRVTKCVARYTANFTPPVLSIPTH